jgi:hypothetical protein
MFRLSKLFKIAVLSALTLASPIGQIANAWPLKCKVLKNLGGGVELVEVNDEGKVSVLA